MNNVLEGEEQSCCAKRQEVSGIWFRVACHCSQRADRHFQHCLDACVPGHAQIAVPACCAHRWTPGTSTAQTRPGSSSEELDSDGKQHPAPRLACALSHAAGAGLSPDSPARGGKVALPDTPAAGGRAKHEDAPRQIVTSGLALCCRCGWWLARGPRPMRHSTVPFTLLVAAALHLTSHATSVTWRQRCWAGWCFQRVPCPPHKARSRTMWPPCRTARCVLPTDRSAAEVRAEGLCCLQCLSRQKRVLHDISAQCLPCSLVRPRAAYLAAMTAAPLCRPVLHELHPAWVLLQAGGATSGSPLKVASCSQSASGWGCQVGCCRVNILRLDQSCNVAGAWPMCFTWQQAPLPPRVDRHALHSRAAGRHSNYSWGQLAHVFHMVFHGRGTWARIRPTHLPSTW